MNCKKCGIEMRLDSRETENGLRQEFSCRNPQCDGFGAVQASRTVNGEGEYAEE